MTLQLNRPTAIVLLLVTCSLSAAGRSVTPRDLYSDTWVATDALGRSLPGYEECGAPRENRTIAMFYFLWLGQHSNTGPWDITQLLAENPDSPAWGPRHHFHHWGESELGYYISDDPYVLRRHASMLSDAGVDVIVFDVTNSFTYKKVYTKLCEVFTQIRQAGGTTPQIAFMTHSNSVKTTSKLYADFYRSGLYQDLWFYWKGKPLILADLEGHSSTVQNFFTFRFTWAWTQGQDIWNWIDRYPQDYGWHENPMIPEETSVGVASHATNNTGRSYHNGKQPPIDTYHSTGTEHLGLHFAEQWQQALRLDPEFIFVTGWNEWVAQRFVCGQDKCPNFLGHKATTGQSWFVDNYNHEFSRDIEPMKDGHTDNYYYQLVANIRKYKGVRPLPTASGPSTITIDGNFNDWSEVTPTYYDTVGDTEHRDWPGWGNLHYTETSGRNDIVCCKVAHDRNTIYFYVQTAQPLTPVNDPNWMQLYLDIDQDPATGWQGYDYRINGNIQRGRSSLEHTGSAWDWQEIDRLSYRAQGNQLEIAVPRVQIEQIQQTIGFDFHWADNVQRNHNITSFFIHGDSAPNRRFNYRYLYSPYARP